MKFMKIDFTIYSINQRFSLCLIFFLIFSSETYANPLGKGLSCFVINKKPSNYNIFRGLYFESEKFVRVVSIKNKNNSLKIISKQTHYKISDDLIKFKIKFIWYGDISFEDFELNRNTLKLMHTSKNEKNDLSCEVSSGDFMNEMNKLKKTFQFNYDQELKKNKI